MPDDLSVPNDAPSETCTPELSPPSDILTGYEDGSPVRALDLFSGMGGWSLAASRLGFKSSGVEIWDPARETREAAGFPTVARDVRDLITSPGDFDLLIASPPCQTFSTAGSGSGRKALSAVLEGIDRFAAGELPAYDELTSILGDERTALVLEPLRHAITGEPDFLAWEQVPNVRPVWEACATVLSKLGYFVWTGNVSAERFGVPQTRRRAVLLATKAGPLGAPLPTHRALRSSSDTLIDLPAPVSMAEALGRDDDGTQQRSNYSGPPSATKRTAAERGRSMRALSEPSVTITGRSFQWESPDGTRTRSTVRDALLLQSFPEDFPVQGDRGDIVRLQIGNAVPPVLAEALLRHVVAAKLPAPKQGTRMLKVICPADGYTIRTTNKWLQVGFPTCPCGTVMRREI